jgi:hypothetical protein
MHVFNEHSYNLWKYKKDFNIQKACDSITRHNDITVKIFLEAKFSFHVCDNK